jgi:pimeloyl-ACP methyl ester carboxylesterase
MKTHRPAMHLTTIPNAGHDVHLDQPRKVYEAIATFLQTA